MDWKKESKVALWMALMFLGVFFMPVGQVRFERAILESLYLLKWYAQEHVLLCLLPAFFIAGAISVFINQASVIKYLGAQANKVVAYGVASVSGTVLAVCSCTVLPLFSGIYHMGAGLGPATAFLYSGPAINVLAIILTARVLGLELGIARAVGAIAFSVVIGLCMQFIFRKEEAAKQAQAMAMPTVAPDRNLAQNALYFASMVGILVFANWAAPVEDQGIWATLYGLKWCITGAFGLLMGLILVRWFGMRWWKVLGVSLMVVLMSLLFPGYPLLPFAAALVGLSVITATDGGENQEWFESSWGFCKQILPLLFMGVLVAGALLGRVGEEGLIPSAWIDAAVGGNSLRANFFAAVAGAFMYFATLTEVPILQGLMGNGMGKGPALALLLAGPALSLPNMLVIRSVLGTKKTVVFVLLVVIMATLSGVIFGALM